MYRRVSWLPVVKGSTRARTMATADVFMDMQGFIISGQFYPRELAIVSGPDSPQRVRFRQPVPFRALRSEIQRRISEATKTEHGHFWTYVDGWGSEEIAMVLRRLIPRNSRIIIRKPGLDKYLKEIGPAGEYLCLDRRHIVPTFEELARRMHAAHCERHDQSNNLACAVQNVVNLQEWFNQQDVGI